MPHAKSISAHDLADQLSTQRVSVIDVREPMEYASCHIAGSLNVPLNRLRQADLPQGPSCWSARAATAAIAPSDN